MPFLQFIMAGKNRVSQVKTSEISQSAIIKTFFWTSKSFLQSLIYAVVWLLYPQCPIIRMYLFNTGLTFFLSTPADNKL